MDSLFGGTPSDLVFSISEPTEPCTAGTPSETTNTNTQRGSTESKERFYARNLPPTQTQTRFRDRRGAPAHTPHTPRLQIKESAYPAFHFTTSSTTAAPNQPAAAVAAPIPMKNRQGERSYISTRVPTQPYDRTPTRNISRGHPSSRRVAISMPPLYGCDPTLC